MSVLAIMGVSFLMVTGALAADNATEPDRKSVVEGKTVDNGGRRIN